MTDPTPQTTPTRDEAVRPPEMAAHILRIAIEDRQATDTVEMNVGDLSVMLGLLLASAPASGGGDAVAWHDVLAERLRQVEAEGWSAAHDDEHGNGEMARAAASYALEHAAWTYTETPSARLMEAARSVWPWGKEWWKPSANRRMLVKAAALILAEIERLDRKEGAR